MQAIPPAFPAPRQAHGDRLSALDTSFLAQEKPNAHMHLGAVTVFAAPALGYDELVTHIGSRLHLVPRYRQKLAVPPLGGRPLWIDDRTFELGYHVRHAALPAPGTEAQLDALAARVHSQPLDRSRPLWEIWLVEGLADGRCALVSKTHHALVDGVGGVDLVTVLFSSSAESGGVPPDQAWAPHPEPSPAAMAMRGLAGAAKSPVRLAERLAGATRHPTRALRATLGAAEGLGEIAWAVLNPAPATPLNVEIGPHRRVAFVRCPLDDFKRVKNVFGGTVNDVIMAVVSGALRELLRSRGVSTDGLELRALVPVSVRGDHERHALGNRIVAMRAPLPVYLADAVARLSMVKQSMDALKRSKQGVGVAALARIEQLAPPRLLAQATRLNFSARLFNLLVTNVPGPQFPLYLLGRRLEHLFPVAFLPHEHALAIAAVSYDGEVAFGLLGDYDAMPDLDFVATGIRDSLDELVARAAASGSVFAPPAATVERRVTAPGTPWAGRGEAAVRPVLTSPQEGPGTALRGDRRRRQGGPPPLPRG